MNSGAPLSGVRVLDVTQVVSGPCSTMMLADLGADVIKIERPDGGDPYRHEGTIIENERGAVAVNFLRFNRNKKSLTLNLKDAAGAELFKRLVAEADVVVENFRPGVMKRMGLDYEVLKRINPRLIHASISGFGHDDVLPASPYSALPAYAIICEAYSGILHLVGESPDRPPHWLGFALADITAGMMTVVGILAALRGREFSGEGRRVDISMYDASMFMNDQAIALYATMSHVMERGPYTLQAPWGLFPTRDGYVAISVMGDKQWEGLCRAIGRPDLAKHPDCATGPLRGQHMDTLIRPSLEGWLRERDRAEAIRLLQAQDVPSAPVNTPADLFTCRHVEARQMLVPFRHPVVGDVKTVGNPVKLSGVTAMPASAPPELGQHTRELLQELLGMSEAEVDRLKEAGVV